MEGLLGRFLFVLAWLSPCLPESLRRTIAEAKEQLEAGRRAHAFALRQRLAAGSVRAAFGGSRDVWCRS